MSRRLLGRLNLGAIYLWRLASDHRYFDLVSLCLLIFDGLGINK